MDNHYSPYLIINITWDTDFPKMGDICKIYGLIPIVDDNRKLFGIDLEKGKKTEKDLMLYEDSNDMNNISETGSENIVNALTPDLSRASELSQEAGSYIDLTTTGWIFAFLGFDSTLELKRSNVSGSVIMSCMTNEDNKMSDHMLLVKNTRVYVNSRSGSVTLTFYPCKGLAS